MSQQHVHQVQPSVQHFQSAYDPCQHQFYQQQLNPIPDPPNTVILNTHTHVGCSPSPGHALQDPSVFYQDPCQHQQLINPSQLPDPPNTVIQNSHTHVDCSPSMLTSGHQQIRPLQDLSQSTQLTNQGPNCFYHYHRSLVRAKTWVPPTSQQQYSRYFISSDSWDSIPPIMPSATTPSPVPYQQPLETTASQSLTSSSLPKPPSTPQLTQKKQKRRQKRRKKSRKGERKRERVCRVIQDKED